MLAKIKAAHHSAGTMGTGRGAGEGALTTELLPWETFLTDEFCEAPPPPGP